MFDSPLPVSWYRELSPLNEEHKVYAVQHRETGKLYVKKVLTVFNPEVYAALFRHPVAGVPRIYALYHDKAQQTLTVIEEYISGDALSEILEIRGAFSPRETVDCAVRLCQILQVLHGFDPPVIHRDIKPSNIIRTEDGRIVLIDLNAARLADPSRERDTRLLGTKGYAAPEQYGFGASTPATDIYAVGVLMRTLLTGGKETAAGTEGTAPGSPGIPGVLDRIIQKCCEMNPADRYPSVDRLLEALQLPGISPGSSPDGSAGIPPTVPAWDGRRHPRLVGCLLASLIFLLLFMAAVLLFSLVTV